ncbi:hypothetical protein [Treponema sp. OMZ 789]|nr:hypothetical protein [Treponema sp. OMZ 789]UTC67438.1 hypothetical protein E4O06_01855 [Treponema sp. OMZ 789]
MMEKKYPKNVFISKKYLSKKIKEKITDSFIAEIISASLKFFLMPFINF